MKLFPMVQRYKFESKSQRDYQKELQRSSCFQWFKGTNLKANHNSAISVRWPCLLFPMVQRYKFESKSQLIGIISNIPWSCFQWFKGTNLKANHNKHLLIKRIIQVVSNGSKVQIWKQITTDAFVWNDVDELFPMVQRYKFESKSQLSKSLSNRSNRRFSLHKDTHLKANHNILTCVVMMIWLHKDTHLKANHNTPRQSPCPRWPFPMVQKYKFHPLFTSSPKDKKCFSDSTFTL